MQLFYKYVFPNIFFLSVACLFLFLMVSFEEQKLVILLKSSLTTSFIVIAFVSHFRILCLGLGHRGLCPLFSYRNFIILKFRLRVWLIWNQFLFMVSGKVKQVLSVIPYGFQFSSIISWKCLTFYIDSICPYKNDKWSHI